MIKLLMVEDNPSKAEKVKSLLSTEIKIGRYSIESVDNIKSAKELLYNEKYDVIILDLVLPLDEDDKDPSAEKGVEFLDDIYDNPSIVDKPIHIIGLTARADLKPQFEKQFHKNLNHLIDYQEESYNWKDQLKNFIWRLIEKEDEFFKNRATNYDYDIAIITALDIEFDAVKNLSKKWSRKTVSFDSTTYLETIFEGNDKSFRVIAACAPQMGMNASAALSMKLIYNFRPRYLFMTGIAASVKDSDAHGYGDIIVFDESWDGGGGKITENSKGETIFLQSANHLRLNSDIKEKMRSVKENKALLRAIKDAWHPYNSPQTELRIHIGSVASVAGVIENKAIIDELKLQDRKLLGLEMEAFGMYYSSNNCSNPKPISIALKSISDFANIAKKDDFQAYASYTSAKVMYEFIIAEL